MTEESVNTIHFAECRANEIGTLMEEIVQKGPKLSHQKLPFHMRRRAASHNPKRIPKSVRLKAQEEITSKKQKKKSKQHKNLLEEYNSRQGSHTWLPTHVWFAKRFHMKKMWGYQLPFQATGKRFRSSYRASVQNALLQDMSYFCCIELRGKQESLLAQLSRLTSDSIGLSFAAEWFISGTNEGHCFLYHPDKFPLNALGPVSFLWKPSMDSSSERQLWVWSHPSIADELVKVFIDIFNLKESTDRPSKEYSFTSKVNYMKCKLHFQKEPVYCNDDVTMSVLKDTFVRHRIIGPNATSIITSVLKPVESSEEGKLQIWNYLLSNRSEHYVPMKSVIGLRVEDPRLFVAPKKEDSFHEENEFEDVILEEFSRPESAVSELWDIDIRNEVTVSQVPEHIINTERGKKIILDASDLKGCTTTVPVIIVHQPASNGYASGWDIIAPQGWGMAFWIPIIHHGAQPAGLDDLCYTNMECARPSFPLSFPDTKAGYSYEESTREEKLKKFYRYSRAKRPNFKILGVQSPFFMPWSVLVSEWKKEFVNRYDSSSVVNSASTEDSSFFTLRDKKEIKSMQNFCSLLKKQHYDKENIASNYKMIQNTLMTKQVHLKAILLVRIKCLSRGVLTNCSGIYIPTSSDLQSLKENQEYFGPKEGMHSANPELSGMPDRKRRKILKEEARQESKKLERPNVEALLPSAEREVIGYVSEGGFSRLGGRCYGIGHCALTGFFALLEMCMNCSESGVVVLIRDQDSFQYRFATLEVTDNLF